MTWSEMDQVGMEQREEQSSDTLCNNWSTGTRILILIADIGSCAVVREYTSNEKPDPQTGGG